MPNVPGIPGMPLPAEQEEALIRRLAELTGAKVPKPPNLTKWAAIAACIAALGGGAGLAELVRATKTSPLPSKLDSIHADIREQGEDLRRIHKYLIASHGKDLERWAITESFLCKVNGERPFARNVECQGVEYEALPLSRSGGPGWKAKVDWPYPTRPPAYTAFSQ
jgi:hypothetical protein